MGRLIDADKLIAKIEEIYDGYMLSEDGGVVPKDFVEFLEEAPTVEAIPKADIQKALKEGSKDISENILAIVREEYISKAEYENRLKADMVANYKDIQAEIRRFMYDVNPNSSESDYACNYMIDIIQQKINTLKGEEDGKDN